MRQFKKRTIALVLASVITVIGAFGEENYNNSLLSLKFDKEINSAVNMTILTEHEYTKPINPKKTDANTYVIMLPDVSSRMTAEPELKGNIESVNIRTMPYTKNNNGYTKITIKTTNASTVLTAKSELYIPSQNSDGAIRKIEKKQTNSIVESSNGEIERYSTNIATTSKVTPKSEQKNENINTPTSISQPDTNQNINADINNQNIETAGKIKTQPMSTTETLLLIMAILLVITVCVYFYVKGKNKVADIVGEHSDFDLNDDVKPKKEEQKKQIQSAIKTLDKQYTHPLRMPVSLHEEKQTPHIPIKTLDNDIVVDLDVLFQEKSQEVSIANTEEENQALEDFLNGFSFLDEHHPEEEENLIDEALYEKCINNKNIKFSQNDIEKIQKLLNSEISDETLNNISQFLITNPIEKNKLPPQKVLENFAISYAINQNITFTSKDIAALNSLVNVEIDNDFITDIKTHPERQEQMRAEIEKQKNSAHRANEILTLNVKDMLPDLSQALKGCNINEIKCEAKPEVFYYSEGYDVQTLSVKDYLPDLSIAISKSDEHSSHSTEPIQLADNSYDVDTVSVANELPDLNDVLLHPEKYKETEKKLEKADELSLLQSISNVTFKPFYDGSESIEILNNFDEEDTVTEADIQVEMEQFGDIKIVNNSTEEDVIYETDKISDNNLDNVNKENDVLPVATQLNKDIKSDAEKLIDLIEKQRQERMLKQEEKEKEKKHKNEIVENRNNAFPKSCRVNGEEFEIISSSQITELSGCYLAKNENGYTILGYTEQKIFKIKSYDTLSSEKLQARISENLDNGKNRCIVKVGINKFVLNVSDDDLEYVMDLC